MTKMGTTETGKNWPQFLAATAVAMAALAVGFHTGWPAPSIPKLISEEYPFHVTNDVASYITLIGFVGHVCGGFANVLVDKIGRKRTVQLIAVPHFISFALIVLSYEVMTLIYIGRFIGGLAEGLSINVTSMYVSEIANPKIRGLLGSLVAIGSYSGILLVNVIGSYVTIRTMGLISLILPVVFSIAFWNMPESPYFLLMKEQEERAEDALKFLRCKDDVSHEINALKKDVERQLSETGTLRDIFTIDSNRKAFLVTVGSRFFQTATGVTAFNLYLQVLLRQATNSLAPHIGASIILGIEVVMTIISTFIIDKLGRKPLLLISIGGCCLNLFVQTIYFVLKDYTDIDVSALDWFPMAMMVIHIVTYSLGLGLVTSQVVSEIFSASVKAKLIFLVNGIYAIFTMCMTKFYQVTSDNFGLVVPFGSFAVLSLIGVFFIWIYVPETKGKTLEQIQQRLKGRKKNFAHCNIDELEEHTFYHLNRVLHLHLDNNDLKTLPSELFPHNNNLRTLSITHNHLSRIMPDAFKGLSRLKELDLQGNKITKIEKEVLAPLKELTILKLQNNLIRYISDTTFPPLPLRLLQLMENKIDSLDRGAFANLPSLKRLSLSNNRLVHLKNGTFLNLTRLLVLTLDDNFIETIEFGVFVDVPNLTSLGLVRNQFRSLDKRVLKPLAKLQHLYFDRFELCVSALHARVCYPRGDGISSHEHLLDNPLLRACVWIMGAIGCTGNLIVLLGRFLAPSNNVVHSLYLRNLALSDLLMGVYLFAIGVADHHYRGEYLQYQWSWRHGYMCNLCGFLSTLSCESSVLILTLVTWDRFVSVTQPLARKQLSPKTAALTLVILWTLAVIVASVPFSKGYFGDEFYGNNGVCLPLHIHEPYAMGWEYSAAMFMLVNTFALTFICYAYLRMINEIKASGLACRSTRQSQERDKVAQRFGIIVLTDCLCWVPVIVIKTIALAGHPIPETLYAWLAIFILPINSALNPVLYTLTTTVFKKQMRKIVNSCIHKRPDPQHSASESGFSLSFGVFPIRGSTRRILSYRGTQSSLMTSKNSWKRAPTAV